MVNYVATLALNLVCLFAGFWRSFKLLKVRRGAWSSRQAACPDRTEAFFSQGGHRGLYDP
eukprot:scaffold803_cov310-Pinguiococcus_pyrenoidosus.AAC.158